MMKQKKKLNRIISFVLIMVILTVNISGCGRSIEENIPSSEITINQETLVNSIVNQIEANLEGQEESEDVQSFIYDNWEDYYGDIETFVYGLLMNQMSYLYNVFPAYIELDNGTIIDGIAYTDFQECYADETGENCIFLAGFMPYYGEISIPEEAFVQGLVVHDYEYDDNENTTFVLSYKSEAFTEHCVIYKQYVRYGVDENGVIFFNQTEYQKGEIDKEIGSLYSYDEKKYLYDVDFGNKFGLTGESLSSSIDFVEVEREINRVLDEQDFNFAEVNVSSYAYASQEAITAYFLSMQEETFLGYQVSSLVEISKQLDPMECLRVTGDGLMVVDIIPMPKEGEEAFVKWLVGTGCAILTAVAMVGAVVFIQCPPLSALSGALAGLSMEVFMQVVIENEKLGDINWTRVAIATVTGTVSGLLGPYISTISGKAVNFLVDSSLDGILGAVEQTIIAWMEGATGQELINAFGMGLVMGFAISAGFKTGGELLTKTVKKGIPLAEDFAKKIPVVKKTGRFLNDASKKGNKLFENLQKIMDNVPFRSEYISRKITFRNLERIINEGDEELIKKAFDKLGVDDIFDVDGNPIDKKTLKSIFDKAKDKSTIGYFDFSGKHITIKKQSGMVGIYFDGCQTVTVKNGLLPNRDQNFNNAADEFIKSWRADETLIPESIKKAIESKEGRTIQNLKASELKKIIEKSDWTLHENIDMKTVTLVPTEMHKEIRHMGGVGLAKHVKAHMGKIYFERFVSQAASTAVSTY